MDATSPLELLPERERYDRITEPFPKIEACTVIADSGLDEGIQPVH
jgi:hypothetical protein